MIKTTQAVDFILAVFMVTMLINCRPVSPVPPSKDAKPLQAGGGDPDTGGGDPYDGGGTPDDGYGPPDVDPGDTGDGTNPDLNPDGTPKTPDDGTTTPPPDTTTTTPKPPPDTSGGIPAGGGDGKITTGGVVKPGDTTDGITKPGNTTTGTPLPPGAPVIIPSYLKWTPNGGVAGLPVATIYLKGKTGQILIPCRANASHPSVGYVTPGKKKCYTIDSKPEVAAPKPATTGAGTSPPPKAPVVAALVDGEITTTPTEGASTEEGTATTEDAVAPKTGNGEAQADESFEVLVYGEATIPVSSVIGWIKPTIAVTPPARFYLVTPKIHLCRGVFNGHLFLGIVGDKHADCFFGTPAGVQHIADYEVMTEIVK